MLMLTTPWGTKEVKVLTLIAFRNQIGEVLTRFFKEKDVTMWLH